MSISREKENNFISPNFADTGPVENLLRFWATKKVFLTVFKNPSYWYAMYNFCQFQVK